jgi:uncharacterized coiled-coil protein SlyX
MTTLFNTLKEFREEFKKLEHKLDAQEATIKAQETIIKELSDEVNRLSTDVKDLQEFAFPIIGRITVESAEKLCGLIRMKRLNENSRTIRAVLVFLLAYDGKSLQRTLSKEASEILPHCLQLSRPYLDMWKIVSVTLAVPLLSSAAHTFARLPGQQGNKAMIDSWCREPQDLRFHGHTDH